MSEDEKEAVDFINNIEYKEITSDEFYDNRDILLNLIEKQQKEIEYLRERYKKLVNRAIDVVFNDDNKDVEFLARTLYNQGIIKRDKDNYINPYYETDLL